MFFRRYYIIRDGDRIVVGVELSSLFLFISFQFRRTSDISPKWTITVFLMRLSIFFTVEFLESVSLRLSEIGLIRLIGFWADHATAGGTEIKIACRVAQTCAEPSYTASAVLSGARLSGFLRGPTGGEDKRCKRKAGNLGSV